MKAFLKGDVLFACVMLLCGAFVGSLLTGLAIKYGVMTL